MGRASLLAAECITHMSSTGEARAHPTIKGAAGPILGNVGEREAPATPQRVTPTAGEGKRRAARAEKVGGAIPGKGMVMGLPVKKANGASPAGEDDDAPARLSLKKTATCTATHKARIGVAAPAEDTNAVSPTVSAAQFTLARSLSVILGLWWPQAGIAGRLRHIRELRLAERICISVSPHGARTAASEAAVAAVGVAPALSGVLGGAIRLGCDGATRSVLCVGRVETGGGLVEPVGREPALIAASL